MAVLASYLAGLCDYSDKLAAGERQSKVLLDYAEGTLELTPITKQLIASRTAEMLTLTTGITLEVRSASFRRIRGVTCVAVLADECAFWLSDESANPDVEILNAARPALAMTQGPLIAISSPYARRGALWETYRKHYGPEGDPSILVAQGGTRDFNPDFRRRHGLGPQTKFGTCFFEVDGVPQLDGSCRYVRWDSGDLLMGTVDESTPWASVRHFSSEEKSQGEASWQEGELGAVRPDGACWINERTRICAWR